MPSESSETGNVRSEAWSEPHDDEAERSFVEKHGHVEEITVGTILEYDDWQWALVTELAMDRETPRLGFILLDEVGDHVIGCLEWANGCRQHYLSVEHLRDGEHEYWTDVDYVRSDGVWDVLGPVHPDFREDEPELVTDGGQPSAGVEQLPEKWRKRAEKAQKLGHTEKAIAVLDCADELEERMDADGGPEVRTDGGPDVVDLRKHLDAAIERAHRTDRVELATLAFAEEHADAILGGEKTVTLRLPEAYDQAVVHACEAGSDVLLTTPDGEPFARAEMRALWAATARQVAGSKLAGYPVELSSPDDVLEILERYYGDEVAGAGPTHAVDVLHFEAVATRGNRIGFAGSSEEVKQRLRDAAEDSAEVSD